jgi:nitrogen regulatory protein PII
VLLSLRRQDCIRSLKKDLRGKEMKRIEVVMKNPALDTFKHAAAELGIAEFDVSEVRRSNAFHQERQRLYRGQAYTVDLLAKTKVEFDVLEQDAERIVHTVMETVHPDSISTFTIEELVALERETSGN